MLAHGLSINSGSPSTSARRRRSASTPCAYTSRSRIARSQAPAL